MNDSIAALASVCGLEFLNRDGIPDVIAIPTYTEAVDENGFFWGNSSWLDEESLTLKIRCKCGSVSTFQAHLRDIWLFILEGHLSLSVMDEATKVHVLQIGEGEAYLIEANEYYKIQALTDLRLIMRLRTARR